MYNTRSSRRNARKESDKEFFQRASDYELVIGRRKRKKKKEKIIDPFWDVSFKRKREDIIVKQKQEQEQQLLSLKYTNYTIQVFGFHVYYEYVVDLKAVYVKYTNISKTRISYLYQHVDNSTIEHGTSEMIITRIPILGISTKELFQKILFPCFSCRYFQNKTVAAHEYNAWMQRSSNVFFNIFS